jgi:hypothetical protein
VGVSNSNKFRGACRSSKGFCVFLDKQVSQQELHVTTPYRLGVGLSVIVLANMASAQTPVQPTRQRSASASRAIPAPPNTAFAATARPLNVAPNSRSVTAHSRFAPTATSNQKVSNNMQMNSLNLKSAGERYSQHVQLTTNILNGNKAAMNVAQNIAGGGGGLPPSGGRASASVKATSSPYRASSQVLCRQCRAAASTAPPHQ